MVNNGSTVPPADRVRKKLEWQGECLVFTGGLNRNGYGMVNVPKPDGVGRTVREVHRVMYEDYHGPIPDGMYVLHSCDNPPCVRREHLHLGTQSENLREAVERDRFPEGQHRAAAQARWSRQREVAK